MVTVSTMFLSTASYSRSLIKQVAFINRMKSMMNESEEPPHAALVAISARERAPRRRSTASHSIRVSILRHHAHIATDRGAARARDAPKI